MLPAALQLLWSMLQLSLWTGAVSFRFVARHMIRRDRIGVAFIVALLASALSSPIKRAACNAAPGLVGHILQCPSSASVRHTVQKLDSVAAALDSVAAALAEPPPIDKHVLQNSSRTYTSVARVLQQQANRVQLATADHHLGSDKSARMLKRRLEEWWVGMLDLAKKYNTLQGKFSAMLDSQARMLAMLARLFETHAANVAAMRELAACKRPAKVDRCANITQRLLQDCRDATGQARVQ